MRPRLRLSIVILVGIGTAGCSIHTPNYSDYDAGATDAAAIDAMACTPDTIVCDEATETYVECGSDGAPVREVQCPLGCASDAEVCLDVAPSNGLAGYLDQARDDDTVIDVVFTGASTLDTDTGDATNGGVPLTLTTGSANGMRIFMFKDVEIQGTLKVTGTVPFAIIADGNVTITGSLDASGDGRFAGPGGVVGDPCVGGTNVTATGPIGGGGGGGRFESGARGGHSSGGSIGATGGSPAPAPTLEPLHGGCQGGEGRGLVAPTPPTNGGGGGGGVQISARGTISLTGGGTIDASGGGGASANSGVGSGGGSGGAILLEAPVITLDGSGVVVSAKGGAGGAAGTGWPGADGGTDADPATGGSNAGYAVGGDGGTEAAQPTVGGTGNSTHTSGAGGGGSVGEARLNNRAASLVPAGGAAIRAHYTVAEIASRDML